MDDLYYKNLERDRNYAIEAAKNLHYGLDVADKLRQAKSFSEIETIMATARKRKFEDG